MRGSREARACAALAGQRATEYGFRAGTGVDVGGVEGGYAEVESGPDTGGSLLLLDLRAMRDPVAVRDLADQQAGTAKMSKLHAATLSVVGLIRASGGRRRG